MTRQAGLAAKPGPWGDLALTLPVFLAYHLGVIFLDVRNANDVVTSRLLRLSHGDPALYLAFTAAVGAALVGGFWVLGRGQALRPSKIVQIACEGAAYAAGMGAATSWVVGKIFAGRSSAVDGPFAGFVMSLGAGFYEELAFRVALFGLGAKLLVWVVGHRERKPGFAGVVVVGLWAVVCALLFSGTHYVGVLGDAFDVRSFVARAVLGLTLTLVYSLRGFAAAVWTHALYDVWVLVF